MVLGTLNYGYNNDARGKETQITKSWTRRMQRVGFVFIGSHQGVDEKHLDWLFPRIPDGKGVFNKFCTLSLAHRNLTASPPFLRRFETLGNPHFTLIRRCYLFE